MSEPAPASLAEVIPGPGSGPLPASPVIPAAAVPAPVEIPLEKLTVSSKWIYWTVGILAVAGIVAFIAYKKRGGKVSSPESSPTPTK